MPLADGVDLPTQMPLADGVDLPTQMPLADGVDLPTQMPLVDGVALPALDNSDDTAAKNDNDHTPHGYESSSARTGMKYMYCKCCDIYYSDMKLHIESQRHKMFVAVEGNYKGIDDSDEAMNDNNKPEPTPMNDNNNTNDNDNSGRDVDTVTRNFDQVLKVEDSKGMFRPLFMQFKRLPKIRLEGDLSNGIFGRTGSRRVGVKSGYCECCSIRYSDIKLHIESQRHKMFVASEGNYKGIDELIHEIGPFVVNPPVLPFTNEADLPRRKLVDYSSSDTAVSCAFSLQCSLQSRHCIVAVSWIIVLYIVIPLPTHTVEWRYSIFQQNFFSFAA